MSKLHRRGRVQSIEEILSTFLWSSVGCLRCVSGRLGFVHFRLGYVMREITFVILVIHRQVVHRLAVGRLFGVEFLVSVLEEVDLGKLERRVAVSVEVTVSTPQQPHPEMEI